MRLILPCPHCQSRTVAHSGVELSLTVYEIRYACTNIECGYTFLTLLTAVRTLTPSAKPNPEVHLPMSEDSLAGRTRKKRTRRRDRVITEQRRPLLDNPAIEKIRLLASESGVTISAIAERFGVSGTTIRRVINESEVN